MKQQHKCSLWALVACVMALLLPLPASASPDGEECTHAYEQGFCTQCGALQPDFVAEVNGWYDIATAAELSYISAFACENGNIKIRLTADIDMTGMPYTPIRNFSGTLDGQGHTISHLVMVKEIPNPDDKSANGVSLVAVANGATVKNLTLDSSCYFEGAAYCAGFVGETSGGHLTLEGLVMKGTVKGTQNTAGLYGCNKGAAATISITNCGVAGPVYGGWQAGLISGWFDNYKATLKGVWAIGEVVGYDDAATMFCRPAGGGINFTNCWSVYGQRSGVNNVFAWEATSGELTWKLNGSSFAHPTWYQNIAEGDSCPSLDASRGVVYPVAEGFSSFHPDNAESYAGFKNYHIGVARDYAESDDAKDYAAVALLEEYLLAIEGYDYANSLDEFVPAYEAEQAKRRQVEASVKAYQDYEAVIAEILATLESRQDFAGPARDFLENVYIDGDLAPATDDRAPNGSSDYILAHRTLGVEQLAQEAELARELLRVAVASGYAPGTDITNMLVNADFVDGLNGWQGTLFTGSGTDTREGFNQGAAEIWSNGAHDMYQEIAVARTGVYELRVHGAYRPFDQANAIQYYPYIYVGNHVNYLQAVAEDYLPAQAADDQVNCNLDPAQTPDLPVTSDEGDTLGWAIHGVHSCNVAFSVGRYENRILVQANEGDVLRIGVCHPGSGYGGNEWVGIGRIRLTYVGALADADESLSRVLESQLDRAIQLQNIIVSSDADYGLYPNFSQELKTRLSAAIVLATGAADADAKYAAIAELSDIFKQVIECKQAYKSFFANVEGVYSAAFNAAEIDPACAAMGAQAQQVMEEGMAAYMDGTLSTQEAWDCALVKGLDVYPTLDDEGTYHIANSAQYGSFAIMANTLATADNGYVMNAVLDADVCINNFSIIQNFYGTFDGQGHTLNVSLEGTDNGCAPFYALRGATVRNLIVRGTIATAYKFAAAIAAHSYEANGHGSTIERIQSYVDIIASINGDGTHAGILAVNDGGVGYISNSLFAGSMSGESCSSNGGLVGWAGGNGVRANNCMMIADITAGAAGSNTFGRSGMSTSTCIYLQPYGSTTGGATQMTPEQLRNGEATLFLNNGQSRPDPIWRQTLGEDTVPTLDPTHKVVYRLANGTLANELEHEIEKHSGTEDDPFVIATAQDMALLHGVLMPGRVNYITLANDIDMSSITSWTPLNTAADNYQNIVDFEGNGHVIQNFSCTDLEGSYNSFFGVLCGDVRNVGFANATISGKATGVAIVGSYIGHDQYVDASYTKRHSSLTNVWATGSITVVGKYAGALGGYIAGPTTMTNVYANVAIQAEGQKNYVGGLVGRVRDQLVVDGAYAAGSIQAETPYVGGIIGGGFAAATTPGKYNNIVVWNNTDENFGPAIPAADLAVPEADLFDLAISEDGTLADKSAMANPIDIVGNVNVAWNERFGTYSYFTSAAGDAGKDYLRIDYSTNEALKAALTDGYTLEVTFAVLSDNMNGRKPFSATEGGGFNIESNGSGNLQAPINTIADGAQGYRTAVSPARLVKGEYYHAVATYEQDGKIAIYVNGGNKVEANAPGVLHFPDNAVSQWIGVGCDPGNAPGVTSNAANFEIVNARIYNQPLNEMQVKALYYNLMGFPGYLEGDQRSNVSYFTGDNHAQLQQTVVGWGMPWQCTMAEGAYPTFGNDTADGIATTKATANGRIYTINGIEVQKAKGGIFVIDGKKVMAK